MRIGGLQKNSLIDFPGKICAIVFTMGCNFHCGYCHNPELVNETAEPISESDVFDFLSKRQGKLDAVTITGGEPTIQEDLIPFIKKIKSLGFLVKLDTNGTRSSMVKELQERKLVDYFAMDVKSPLAKYTGTVGRPANLEEIQRTIALLINGSVPYEFRTTIVKTILSFEDLHGIGELIKGAEQYYLQKFVPSKTLNPDFILKTTYSDGEFEQMKQIMHRYVKKCYVR
jgi:pyruvate formate lyase activating enzyme